MSPTYVTARSICSILGVVSVGLLAGVMLGTGMEEYAGRNLPEGNWTLGHQTTDALFRRVMPISFNVTAILLIATSVLAKGRVRWMFGIAALLIVISIIITVGVEVRLNRATASWIPGAAPRDWKTLRDRWLWNHLVRTVASIIAFLCAAAGLVKM